MSLVCVCRAYSGAGSRHVRRVARRRRTPIQRVVDGGGRSVIAGCVGPRGAVAEQRRRRRGGHDDRHDDERWRRRRRR